jgi:hypothetical protein
MDKVMKYWQMLHPNVKLFYSTPQKYLDTIKEINANATKPNLA